METSMVSAALFVVMILLLLVVYDSNTTMQGLVKKIGRSRSHNEHKSHQEVTMDNQNIASELNVQNLGVEGQPVGEPQAVVSGQPPMPSQAPIPTTTSDPLSQSQQSIPITDQYAQSVVNQETITVPSDSLQQTSDKSKGVMEWYIGSFRTLLNKVKPKKRKKENIEQRKTVPEAQNQVVDSMGSIQNELANLTYRIIQAENAIFKIWQLEQDVASANEATQIVSEDMRDVLGSIRTSIDGMDGRLNQLGSEVHQLKVEKNNQPEIPQVSNENTVDEETKHKIKRLQEAVADMTDTLESLPDDIRTAMSNSQSALTTSQEMMERFDIVSDNLQSTPGYGVRKNFRCESCGTHGYIASQVSCSKCGTPGWFGWWPPYEEMQNIETSKTTESQSNQESEDINEMANMFGSGTSQFEPQDDANIEETMDAKDSIDEMDVDALAEMIEAAELHQTSHSDESNEKPGIPDISELAKMIEAADIASPSNQNDLTEYSDEPDTVVLDETVEAHDVKPIDEKPKPKRRPRKPKKQ